MSDAPRTRARRPTEPRPGGAGGRPNRDRSGFVDPRFSRRRRALERSRRRKVVVRSSFVAAAAAGVWGTFFSPLFVVRDIEVSGATHTSTQAVAEAADITGRENLLLFSEAEVVERVEALPWVRAAEVDRILPGTVKVRIEERRPALRLVGADDAWLIDASGRVLGPGDDAAGVPSLVGAETSGLAPGEAVDTPELTTALAVFRSLPRALARDVRGIDAPSPERVTVILDDGTHIRYGAAARLEAKNTVVDVLLDEVDGRGAGTLIDVRVPTNPIVEPAPSPPPGVR